MSTKEFVIKILQENLNKAVSGEFLASECGVSRSAVWKSVNSLRNQGFLIDGLSNGGYIYRGQGNVFSQEAFSKKFSEDFPEYSESHIEFFKEVDSTNTYAKRLLTEAGSLRKSDGTFTEHGKELNNAVIIAESQTAGRGRFGRTFYSPAKTGIYISMIYCSEGGVKNPAGITASAAVAVFRSIKKVFGVECQIKWINDVFCNGKKICGILTEGIANFESGIIEAAVIGIGINIEENQSVPEDVKKVAGSISGAESETAGNYRLNLSSQVAGNMFNILKEDFSDVLKEYKENSFTLGRTVKVYPVIGEEESAYFAKAVDIDNNAGLIVQLKDGSLKTLSSGEVSVKPV